MLGKVILAIMSTLVQQNIRKLKTNAINLPYCGQNSTKLSRQLLRTVNKIAPCVKLNIIFTPSFRINICSKLKTVRPVLNKSNVVYRINCKDCQRILYWTDYKKITQEDWRTQEKQTKCHS